MSKMIRADVQMPFFKKLLWISLGCAAYALWSLFDATVAYPKQLEIAQAYEALPDTDETTDQWTQIATERGWETEAPKKSTSELQGLIYTQYAAIAVCLLVGSVTFLKWWMARGTWIEGDETTFRTSRGKQVQLDALVRVDRSTFDRNGIAVLHFDPKRGPRKLVLDDFKYDRDATEKLLAIAEGKLAEQQPIPTSGE